MPFFFSCTYGSSEGITNVAHVDESWMHENEACKEIWGEMLGGSAHLMTGDFQKILKWNGKLSMQDMIQYDTVTIRSAKIH